MAIQIRMGGFGPPTTTHSRALKIMGDKLTAEFGDAVDVKYLWNVMDFGYRADDLLWMAEQGILTLAYQSTSYLTDRVPELEFMDLPFLFDGLEQARAAIDGPLGAYLSRKIEERIGYRILGYFENGYRHVTNRLRPVRAPADMAGMRIRLMPSRMHSRTFDLLGRSAKAGHPAYPGTADDARRASGVRRNRKAFNPRVRRRRALPAPSA